MMWRMALSGAQPWYDEEKGWDEDEWETMGAFITREPRDEQMRG